MTTKITPSEAMKRRIEALKSGQLPPPAPEETIKKPKGKG